MSILRCTDASGCDRLLAPATDEESDDTFIEIQGEEEEIPVRAAHSPATPSARIVEDHRTGGHIPYRDRCKCCVMGQRLETQHRPATEQANIPVIGLDYFYITSGEVKLK